MAFDSGFSSVTILLTDAAADVVDGMLRADAEEKRRG